MYLIGIEAFFNFFKFIIIKEKVKIVANKAHEYLHREPTYLHPRLRIIPNIIINVITFLITMGLAILILTLLTRFFAKQFYNL